MSIRNIEIAIRSNNTKKRNILGKELCPRPVSNTVLLAGRGSGKSNIIYNIIKKCVNSYTRVFCFVPTYQLDPTWKKIKILLQRRKIPHYFFEKDLEQALDSSLAYVKEHRDDWDPVEYYQDELTEYKEDMRKYKESIKKAKQRKVTKPPSRRRWYTELANNEAAPLTKPIRPKRPYLDGGKGRQFLFIYDDIPEYLSKGGVLRELVRKHRHYLIHNIISIQYSSLLHKRAWGQTTDLYLWKGLSWDDFYMLHKAKKTLVNKMSIQQLYAIYMKLKRYDFLNLDLWDMTIRLNFSKKTIAL